VTRNRDLLSVHNSLKQDFQNEVKTLTMKITVASLLLLDAFQRVHGFSSKVSPVATEKAQGPVELTNWNEQVTEPPPQGGRR